MERPNWIEARTKREKNNRQHSKDKDRELLRALKKRDGRTPRIRGVDIDEGREEGRALKEKKRLPEALGKGFVVMVEWAMSPSFKVTPSCDEESETGSVRDIDSVLPKRSSGSTSSSLS